MSRISSTHYHLDTSGFQHDVAHLFEHLILTGFHDELAKRGYHPGLYGWVSGESFEEDLFIDSGFYDPKVNDLFRQYLKHVPEFGKGTIEHNLSVIQAEDKIIYSVSDEAALQSELEMLSSLLRAEEKHSLNGTGAKPLTSQRRAAAFREVTIEVYAEDVSEEQQKLFLRFYVMLLDIVWYILQRDFACYSYGASRPAVDGNQIGYMQKFIFERRGLTLKQIQKSVFDELTTLDVDKSYPEIRRHFDIYATEPLWQNLPVEYFRHTGIVATNKEVADLATRENINAILSKLQVYARDSRPQDKKHLF